MLFLSRSRPRIPILIILAFAGLVLASATQTGGGPTPGKLNFREPPNNAGQRTAP